MCKPRSGCMHDCELSFPCTTAAAMLKLICTVACVFWMCAGHVRSGREMCGCIADDAACWCLLGQSAALQAILVLITTAAFTCVLPCTETYGGFHLCARKSIVGTNFQRVRHLPVSSRKAAGVLLFAALPSALQLAIVPTLRPGVLFSTAHCT